MSDTVLERLIAESQERPLPATHPREVRLPGVPGKADALLGMRRSGKTYRMFVEMKALEAKGVPRSRMLYLNLEDDRLGPVDLGALDQMLEIFFRRDPSARKEGSWFFLDEVQVVEGWERFARRVLDTEQVRLAVTGSSARMLSTELATAFRGRSMAVEVLPYSMREVAATRGIGLPDTTPGALLRSQLDALVVEYLQCGGFPGVFGLHPHDQIQLLQEYVDLVVLRDVGERHNASNLRVLRELVAALFASNANGFSVSRLHGALTASGWRVAKATLLSYLDHLVDGFLVFLVPIRTRSARQRAANPRKVYAVDPGLAAAMYRAGSKNHGAQLENAVYLELRRRFGRLSDGAIAWYRTGDGLEVDFAIDDPARDGPPALLQVCTSLDDPATRARELRALEHAMAETGSQDATVVTLTQEEVVPTSHGAIRVLPARAFFLGARSGRE